MTGQPNEDRPVVDVLLLTGPAGVGKSTLSWEISSRLAEAGLPHAAVETDELDRVFPKPTREELARLWPGTIDISAINLAALWATYARLGRRRLILSGVMLHLGFDRRWITSAIPDARIVVVRLSADDAALVGRLDRRETGAGRDEQVERSLRQSQRLRDEPQDGLLVVDTTGRGPAELADMIVERIGWLSER